MDLIMWFYLCQEVNSDFFKYHALMYFKANFSKMRLKNQLKKLFNFYTTTILFQIRKSCGVRKVTQRKCLIGNCSTQIPKIGTFASVQWCKISLSHTRFATISKSGRGAKIKLCNIFLSVLFWWRVQPNEQNRTSNSSYVGMPLFIYIILTCATGHKRHGLFFWVPGECRKRANAINSFLWWAKFLATVGVGPRGVINCTLIFL